MLMIPTNPSILKRNSGRVGVVTNTGSESSSGLD